MLNWVKDWSGFSDIGPEVKKKYSMFQSAVLQISPVNKNKNDSDKVHAQLYWAGIVKFLTFAYPSNKAIFNGSMNRHFLIKTYDTFS